MSDHDSSLDVPGPADRESDSTGVQLTARERDASGVVQSPGNGGGEAEAAASGPERRVEELLDGLETAADAAERAAMLREVGELYEGPLGESEHARFAWMQALVEQPEEPTSVQAVERLTETTEQWLEVLQTLQEALPVIAERGAEAEAAACLLLGRWYAEHMERADLELAYVARAAQLHPASQPAWDQLVQAQRRAHAWPDLSGSLLHLASLTEDAAEAADLRAEAARILHRHLDDTERATPLYLQVLDAQADHAEAAEGLSELLRKGKRWEELAELLEKRVALVKGEARAPLYSALGELHEQHLDDAATAARHYAQALESTPAPAPDTLEALARTQRKSGALREAVQTLDTLVDAAEVPAARIASLWQLAVMLEEQQSDFAGAAARLETLLELDPGDETAYGELARLYRRLTDSEALVRTLERHARATSEAERKQSLLLEAARTALTDLGDKEQALSLCERVLGAEPDHMEALRLAARLRALVGRHTSAVEALEMLAEAEPEVAKQAERWVDAGKLLEDEGDLERAIERYQRALSLVPGHAAATEALSGLYRRRDDAHALLSLLEQQASLAEEPERRSAILLEAAALRREALDDQQQAEATYRKSLAASPDNASAALALGELAFEAQDWSDAVRYLQPLLVRTSELPREEALRACLRCGEALEEQGNFEEAEQAYQRAASLSPDSVAPRLQLALLSSACGDHGDALTQLEGLLEHDREALSEAERMRVLLALADVHMALDCADKALGVLGEASELAPQDARVLEAQAEALRATGDDEALLAVLRRQEAIADSAEETVAAKLEMAGVLSERLERHNDAVTCLEQALTLDVEVRKILTRLMSLYSLQERWSELVRTLSRLADLSDEAAVQAKYLATAASVYERHLDDAAKASELFARVVELVPGDDRSFQRYVACLAAQGDHAGRVRALRTRLEQVGLEGEPGPRVELAEALRDALADAGAPVDERVQAATYVQSLAPTAERQRVVLEQMLEQPATYGEQIVQQVRALQEHAPREPAAFRAIASVYGELDHLDAVWCADQALKNLDVATEAEKALFRKHRKQQAAAAQACFDDSMWQQMLEHSDQSPLITDLFASLLPAALHVHSLPLEQHGIDPRRRVDPDRDPRLMVQMLRYAAGVMDVQLPPVYHRLSDQGGLTLLPAEGLAMAFGAAALTPVPDQAMAFVAGRQLSYLRPGHAMRLLEPTGRGLRAWLLAAIRTTELTFPVPGELQSRVSYNLQAIKGALGEQEQTVLGQRVRTLLDQAPELDMKRWAQGVDFTADRVGFVLADSLAASTAVIEAGAGQSDPQAIEGRVDELYRYCICPEYLALRQQLGIAVE